MRFTVKPLGDQAVIIEVAKKMSRHAQIAIRGIAKILDETSPSWLIEYIPAYTTITILYQPDAFISYTKSPFETVRMELQKLFPHVHDTSDFEEKTIKIPVLYGGHSGPDLQFVATHNGLTEEEVIQIHTARDYVVHMIGFAPGFPFIGGMSEKIATPRKDTPRLVIPARSVGIAGTQTGVYPIETPGGWQLIGRTPLELFLPNQAVPSLLKAGDKIRFYPITAVEYEEMRGDSPCSPL